MKERHSGLIDFFTPYLPLGVVLLLLLFPFYWTFMTPIKPKSELYGSVVTYWPQNVVFDSYHKLFVDFSSIKPMGNSLLVTGVTTLVSLLVSMLATYTFSHFRSPGRKISMIIFLTNNMFPTVLPLIPLCSIIRSMRIPYTPITLILSYTTFTIPFSVWLLNGCLNDLPKPLEETAMVDGTSRSRAFIHIIFPALIPYLVATGAYIFMTPWNEYTFAVLFASETSRTIPVTLKNLISQLGVQWDLLTAGGIITIIPVCIMFLSAQKRLIAGLTAGVVKG